MKARLRQNLGRARRIARQAWDIAFGGRAARQRIGRDYFFRFARRYTDVVQANSGDSRFLVSTHDQILARLTFADGDFDAPQMRRIMEISGIDIAGKTVLEIGANIGTTTVELVRRYGAGRVIAFEPDPENFKLLSLNIIANDLQDHVDAHQTALSDAVGEIVLARSPLSGGDHRVAAPGVGTDSRELITVPVTTLDAFLASHDVEVDELAMVWMDAQGHEGRVLAGATELLRSSVPVLTEYWPEELERVGDLERIERLIAENYRTIIDVGSPAVENADPSRQLAASEITTIREVATFVDLWLLH